MALSITNDNEVGINNFKYQLSSLLTERLLSKLPAKINIGSDSYTQENYLSSWIIHDLRGGILVSEMDEKIHSDRCWWTNCIIDYRGHITLPRLATSLSPPSVLGITDGGLETWTDSTLDNWTYSESHAAFTLAKESTTVDSGTYSAKISCTGVAAGQYGQCLQGAVIWSNDFRNNTFSITIRIYNSDITKNKGQLLLDDGVSITTANSTGSGAYETVTATKKLGAAATKLDVIFRCLSVSAAASDVYFDTVTFPTSGTLSKACNFNGNLYWSYGGYLLKLASDRSALEPLAAFYTDITDLKASLNSRMYVYLGDDDNYFYMTTAETFTQSDSANAYWGVQWADELWKLKSDGTFSASSDPDGGSPTWSDEGDITDIADQIEGLFVGRDADGNSVIYCPTNSLLKVYDDTNTKWLDTEVKLPNHPNGGKGACYYNGAICLSYGLGVKKYVPESGVVTEIGLNRNDGLPSEYNGEIVKLYADSGSDMFALVDASQTSGNTKSGLYAYNDRAWCCFWIDTSDNGAMHDVIVSPAASEYAVYWDCGGSIYYIDLPRGSFNPNLLGTSTLYESYSTGADSSRYIDASVYGAQTFTPDTNHTVNYLSLSLKKTGTGPGSIGDVTIGIYATDGSGHPTGSALCSGVIDGDALSTDFSWVGIDLGAGTSLTASTKYAIVISAPYAAAPYRMVSWEADLTSPTYSDGNYEESTDSGSSWTAKTYDAYFKEYYIAIPFYFASSGIFISPWFDAGNAARDKMGKSITTFTKGITANETITIKYRLNHTSEEIDTGWNTIDTLNSSSDNGKLENLFASGAGLEYNSIQYRLDLARGSTTTMTPNLQALVLSYKLITASDENKAWNFTINIDDAVDKTTAKQKYENIWSALRSSTLVPLIFRRDDTNETHYVQLFLNGGFTQTGVHYNGQMALTAVEI